MKKVMSIKIDATLQRQISAARLSESEREVALSAMRTANMIVDAAEWFVKKVEQFGARLFLKPSFKH